MTRPTLEQLMAYADGALDEAEARKIEVYLETDEKARQMLADFAITDDHVRRAFEAPMFEAPPQALIDTIMTAKTPGLAGTSNVVSLRDRQPRLLRSPMISSLMAASVAFAVGGAFGFFASQSPESGAQMIAIGAVDGKSEIAAILARSTSGQKLALKAARDRETSITITSSFRDGKGRVCREFETDRPQSEGTIAAIACRQPQGMWVVEGASRIASAAADPNAYIPSSSAAREPLAGVLTMLSAGKALSPAEEAAVLREWKK